MKKIQNINKKTIAYYLVMATVVAFTFSEFILRGPFLPAAKLVDNMKIKYILMPEYTVKKRFSLVTATETVLADVNENRVLAYHLDVVQRYSEFIGLPKRREKAPRKKHNSRQLPRADVHLDVAYTSEAVARADVYDFLSCKLGNTAIHKKSSPNNIFSGRKYFTFSL